MQAKPPFLTRIALFAAVGAVAMTAGAQPQRPDTATPSPMTETRIEPSGELKEASPPRLEQSAARGRSDLDARHCLDLASNAQVHRCAERYRTRPTQAKSRSTLN